MKKTIQILIFLFISLTSFAQRKKDTLSSKWEIGLSPSYIYEYPTYHSYPKNKNTSLGGINLSLKYNISKLFHLTYGISYDNLGYTGSEYISNSNYSFENGFYSETFKYSLLSPYFRLNFNVGWRKLFFEISPGFYFENIIDNEYLVVKFHHVVNGITPPSFAKGA
jgi:hypothetical protein